MSDTLRGSVLVRRVMQEHRRTVMVLAALLVANVLVYAFVVYPLGQRVANIQQRDRLAEAALNQARAEHAQATGTLTGKDRAATELTSFYKDVLPADLAGARRLTHLRLAQLARESNLRFDRSAFATSTEKGSTLQRLKIEMNLGGSYGDIRAFIHQLETAQDFIVIDNVQLTEDDANGGALAVNIELSTYFREVARR